MALEYMGLKINVLVRRYMKCCLRKEKLVTLFVDLRKNIVYSVKYATPTLFSFWESISSKECEYLS